MHVGVGVLELQLHGEGLQGKTHGDKPVYVTTPQHTQLLRSLGDQKHTAPLKFTTAGEFCAILQNKQYFHKL